MEKKLDAFLERLFNNNNFARFLLIMTIINCAIFCTIVAIKKNWDILDYYPEGTYRHLEEEASRLINKREFKTSYDMQVSYDNSTNILVLILTSGQSKVTANVTDFGKPTESVKISRDMLHPNNTIVFNVLLIIVFSFFWAVFEFILLLIVCFVLWIISFFIKH